MRKLILKMSISLDGFVGGPNGEADWIFKNSTEDDEAWTLEAIWEAGVHIMGRRTFNDMAAWWPTSTEPFAAPMNEIPKVVFSRGGAAEPATTQALKDAARAREAEGGRAASQSAGGWDNVPILTGDLAEEIGRLKRQPGKAILAHGGAGFARSLVERGLVDEYQLLVFPVALGAGLPLFSSLAEPAPLKLLSSTAFSGGAVAQVYRPL